MQMLQAVYAHRSLREEGQRSDFLHDGDSVVVENCRNIFGRELVGGVADEKTCLANSTVADDDTSEKRQSISTCPKPKASKCRCIVCTLDSVTYAAATIEAIARAAGRTERAEDDLDCKAKTAAHDPVTSQ